MKQDGVYSKIGEILKSHQNVKILSEVTVSRVAAQMLHD